jgi:hypothetical protein
MLKSLNGDHGAVSVRSQRIYEGSVTEIRQALVKFVYPSARGATLKVVEVQNLN